MAFTPESVGLERTWPLKCRYANGKENVEDVILQELMAETRTGDGCENQEKVQKIVPPLPMKSSS